MPALEAVSRELSLEVQRTFDYFASTAESERIGKIVSRRRLRSAARA